MNSLKYICRRFSTPPRVSSGSAVVYQSICTQMSLFNEKLYVKKIRLLQGGEQQTTFWSAAVSSARLGSEQRNRVHLSNRNQSRKAFNSKYLWSRLVKRVKSATSVDDKERRDAKEIWKTAMGRFCQEAMSKECGQKIGQGKRYDKIHTKVDAFKNFPADTLERTTSLTNPPIRELSSTVIEFKDESEEYEDEIAKEAENSSGWGRILNKSNSYVDEGSGSIGEVSSQRKTTKSSMTHSSAARRTATSTQLQRREGRTTGSSLSKKTSSVGFDDGPRGMVIPKLSNSKSYADWLDAMKNMMNQLKVGSSKQSQTTRPFSDANFNETEVLDSIDDYAEWLDNAVHAHKFCRLPQPLAATESDFIQPHLLEYLSGEKEPKIDAQTQDKEIEFHYVVSIKESPAKLTDEELSDADHLHVPKPKVAENFVLKYISGEKERNLDVRTTISENDIPVVVVSEVIRRKLEKPSTSAEAVQSPVVNKAYARQLLQYLIGDESEFKEGGYVVKSPSSIGSKGEPSKPPVRMKDKDGSGESPPRKKYKSEVTETPVNKDKKEVTKATSPTKSKEELAKSPSANDDQAKKSKPGSITKAKGDVARPPSPIKTQGGASKPSTPSKDSEKVPKPTPPIKAKGGTAEPTIATKFKKVVNKLTSSTIGKVEITKPSSSPKVEEKVSKPSLPTNAKENASKTASSSKVKDEIKSSPTPKAKVEVHKPPTPEKKEKSEIKSTFKTNVKVEGSKSSPTAKAKEETSKPSPPTKAKEATSKTPSPSTVKEGKTESSPPLKAKVEVAKPPTPTRVVKEAIKPSSPTKPAEKKIISAPPTKDKVEVAKPPSPPKIKEEPKSSPPTKAKEEVVKQPSPAKLKLEPKVSPPTKVRAEVAEPTSPPKDKPVVSERPPPISKEFSKPSTPVEARGEASKTPSSTKDKDVVVKSRFPTQSKAEADQPPSPIKGKEEVAKTKPPITDKGDPAGAKIKSSNVKTEGSIASAAKPSTEKIKPSDPKDTPKKETETKGTKLATDVPFTILIKTPGKSGSDSEGSPIAPSKSTPPKANEGSSPTDSGSKKAKAMRKQAALLEQAARFRQAAKQLENLQKEKEEIKSDLTKINRVVETQVPSDKESLGSNKNTNVKKTISTQPEIGRINRTVLHYEELQNRVIKKSQFLGYEEAMKFCEKRGEKVMHSNFGVYLGHHISFDLPNFQFNQKLEGTELPGSKDTTTIEGSAVSEYGTERPEKEMLYAIWLQRVSPTFPERTT